MSSDIKIINKTDFVNLARQRFGHDKKKWQFICPNCGTVQTEEQFIEHGVTDYESVVAFSCIGRYVDGIGCNWTLGGLFKIHNLEVMDDDGKSYPFFDLAEPN